MPNAILTDRAILAIEAPTQIAAIAFLQPLLTQNIEKITKNKLQYALHLTPQGRVVADMFTFVHPKNPKMLCLDVHRNMLMLLAKRLHGYVLNQPIQLHNLSDDIQVVAHWGEDLEGVADPRLPNLGTRDYVFSTQEEEQDALLEDYHAHRLSHGVPDAYLDLPPEKALPSNCFMQYLNAIDFNKGCYVGQEVTARLHYKSKKPTKLMYQSARADNQELMPILHPTSGTEIGWLGASFGGRALATLQTRMDPTCLPDLQLTLPAYVPSDMLIKN